MRKGLEEERVRFSEERVKDIRLADELVAMCKVVGFFVNRDLERMSGPEVNRDTGELLQVETVVKSAIKVTIQDNIIGLFPVL